MLCQNFLAFQGWITYTIVHICPVLFLSVIHLSVGILVVSTFGYCEKCCYEYPLKTPVSMILDIVYRYIYPKVELLDHMIILFLFFLRKLHTVFHNSCPISQSHQQCITVLLSVKIRLSRDCRKSISGVHARETVG